MKVTVGITLQKGIYDGQAINLKSPLAKALKEFTNFRATELPGLAKQAWRFLSFGRGKAEILGTNVT